MPIPGFEHIPGLTPRVVACADRFLVGIKRYTLKSPATGGYIADSLGIRQSQVAALARYLWEKGEPIGSCGKGYYSMHTTLMTGLSRSTITRRARGNTQRVAGVPHHAEAVQSPGDTRADGTGPKK